MANKYYNSDTVPSRQSGGKGGTNEPAGEPENEASDTGSSKGENPSLSESRRGPDRSGGDPTTGPRGPFYVKKSGL